MCRRYADTIQEIDLKIYKIKVMGEVKYQDHRVDPKVWVIVSDLKKHIRKFEEKKSQKTSFQQNFSKVWLGNNHDQGVLLHSFVMIGWVVPNHWFPAIFC